MPTYPPLCRDLSLYSGTEPGAHGAVPLDRHWLPDIISGAMYSGVPHSVYLFALGPSSCFANPKSTSFKYLIVTGPVN